MSDSQEAPEALPEESNKPQPESTLEATPEEPPAEADADKIIEGDEAVSTPAAEAENKEVEDAPMTEEIAQPPEEQEVQKQDDGETTRPDEGVPEDTEEQKASEGEQMETVKEEEGEEKGDKEKEVPPETEDVDEAPVITESLSRGETPTLELDGPPTEDDLLPRPISPEGEGIDEEQYQLLEDEIEIPQYDREELLQSYQTALNEREQLNQQNHALQHKLSEYFRKKKTEEARQEVDKNVTDQEQRYMKYMSNLDELRQQQTVEQETYNEQLEELKVKKTEKHGKVEVEWTQAIEFKKAVAVAAINSRSGRPIPGKDIELYEQLERKKEAEVSQVRLENIKLKNRLRKQELQLKQKEELAEGLHLIDFEQLKIENQTYNEKIEERNEELLKLRKKITSTVQVLTHLKEKLQFVQAENHVRKLQLSEVEQDVAQKRDILSRTKQSRDALRHDNQKLQQKCGLLGNANLLRDFETSTDEADDLYHRLDLLKRTHAELTLNLNGIKRKIELAKETKR